jgi:hypothetical protein
MKWDKKTEKWEWNGWGGGGKESSISVSRILFYFHHAIKNRFDFQIFAQGSGTVPGECLSLVGDCFPSLPWAYKCRTCVHKEQCRKDVLCRLAVRAYLVWSLTSAETKQYGQFQGCYLHWVFTNARKTAIPCLSQVVMLSSSSTKCLGLQTKKRIVSFTSHLYKCPLKDKTGTLYLRSSLYTSHILFIFWHEEVSAAFFIGWAQDKNN